MSLLFAFTRTNGTNDLILINYKYYSDVTQTDSLISFNVYDRSVVDQGFLGTVQIKPVLIHDHTVDQWYK